jgi:hypothetical protein
MLIFGLIIFFVGSYIYPEISSLSSGIFGATLLVGMFIYFDDKIFKNVNIKKEIVDEKNMALAVYYLGIVLLICTGFIGAMLVFFTLKT